MRGAYSPSGFFRTRRMRKARMAMLMAMTAILTGVTRWASSYTSSGRNEAVMMMVKYSAQRFLRARPVPSVRTMAA